jgi:hypothetical protein
MALEQTPNVVFGEPQARILQSSGIKGALLQELAVGPAGGSGERLTQKIEAVV